MASGRALRKSPRTASPLPGSTNGRTHSTVDVKDRHESRKPSGPYDKLAPWIEPPVRDPIPSFEEHPGIERGGVLEYMQPLGQFPSQRVKLRVRQYEPPKRYVQTRLMQGLPDDGAGKRGPGRRRRSQSREVEPATPQPEIIPASEETVKEEIGPGTGSRETRVTKLSETPLRSLSTPTTQNPLPAFTQSATASTYAGNAPYESLKETIDAALARSIEKKQQTRGLAIRKLYEEGFTNPTLAGLLDAILAQKANEEQQRQFQTYIKVARKEFKAEKNHSRRSSTTVGANAIVESIENSPVSRLLATAAGQPYSSQHISSDHQPPLDLSSLPHHPSSDLSSLHHHTSTDPHHPSSRNHTFHHHNNFPDKDTPLASLEGGVSLSPTPLEFTTDNMPPKKRAAETVEVVTPKRAKLEHNGTMPKPTARKPLNRKRSAPQTGDAQVEEPSAKRVKRDASTTSQESALTEMDSDGLKDLEEVAVPEASPHLSVDAPFAKSSNLLPCNQKNASSFLAPAERQSGDPSYVATKESRDMTAKETAKDAGRPTRTKFPSKKAIEAAEAHRVNLPAVAKDTLDHGEVAKLKATYQHDHPGYQVEESHVRPATVERSVQPSPAPITPTLTLPSTTQQETNDPEAAALSDDEELLIPPPPGAAAVRTSNRPSRVQTPRAASPVRTTTTTTRITRNGNKGARVKHSPKKRSVGVTAGLASSSGGNRVLGNAQAEGDNYDFCSACSGAGQLVLCDACPRSFHFSCLDPPMKETPEGQWFCHVCVDSRAPPAVPSTGIFGALLANLEKGNPVAFSLPAEIRTFFEGVETGEGGEFQAVEAPLKRGKRARADAERECADYGQLKGNVVLCAACGGNSRKGKRTFLPCDFCSLHWHLDCLDPPMANPPSGKDGRPAAPWKCPSHVDTEFLNAARQAQPTASGQRVVKLRRPKNPHVVDATTRPGLRNNGMIDVELEPSDDEDAIQESNVVHRMTEEGIKLDFINQVIKGRIEPESRRSSATELTELSTANKEALDGDSMPPPPPPRKRSKTGHSPRDALSPTELENMRLGTIIRNSLPAFTAMDEAERDAVVMLAAMGTATSFGAGPSTLTPPITHDSPPATTTTNTTGATDVASINASAVAANAAKAVTTTSSSPTSTEVAALGHHAPDAAGSIGAGMGTSTVLGPADEGSPPNGTIVVAAAASSATAPPPPPPTPKKAKKEKPKAAEPARKSTRAAANRSKKGKVPA